MLEWFNFFALVLIVAGLLVRWHCVEVNGSFSSQIKKPYYICRSGLYRYIRHPAYLGTLFFVFGFSYLLLGLAAAVLMSYLFYIVLSDRALREESLLRAHFPEFPIYKAETGFFFFRVF